MWYHGSHRRFSKFVKPDTNRMADRAAIGFWFTASRKEAETFGPIVYVVRIKPRGKQHWQRITERTLDFIAVSEPLDPWVKKLQRQGYRWLRLPARRADAATQTPGHALQAVVFDADDIEILEVHDGT